jgi:GNAT superfamily N-acetyltransferase
MDIQIRFAQRKDLQSIRQLVIELAIFEKEPDAVIATLMDYQRAFDDGLISILVAEIENEIVGMTLFYDTFSTWKGKMLYLEDFVVKEPFRSRGIGSLLFDATLNEAKNRDCALMKWQVLDWNTEATKFYMRKKAEIEKEWWNGKIMIRVNCIKG